MTLDDASASRDYLARIRSKEPLLWLNRNREPAAAALKRISFGRDQVNDAAERMQRFAPLLARLFPETEPDHGIVESELRPAPQFARALAAEYRLSRVPKILLKCDNELPIAGSIKARGGVYEVLCYAERVAVAAGLLSADLAGADYLLLNQDAAHGLFSQHTVTVASTGNLGLSVGITGRALGFKVEVHMSSDARLWKKRLLRERGATVIEHRGDYSAAVVAARQASSSAARVHFVDDERSQELFLGYSVAALRLGQQLEPFGQRGRLNFYLPCGVGGGPGGVTFGLKQTLADRARCYFAEPTHAPCFLLGMITGTAELHVTDFGLDGRTAADGLAVGMPSPLVLPMMQRLLDGVYTCDDERLFRLLYLLWQTEGVRAEPSAAAALMGPLMVREDETARGGTGGTADDAPVHVCWLTGGAMLPERDFYELLERGQRSV